jgi:hypothetical protein
MAGLTRLSLAGFLVLGLLAPGAAVADKAPCPSAAGLAMTSFGSNPSVGSQAAEGQSAKQEKAPEAKAEEKRQKERDPLAYYDYTDDL